jgi:hypothetical protein
MLDHGQTVRNAFFLTSRVEHVRHVGSCRPIRVARRGPSTTVAFWIGDVSGSLRLDGRAGRRTMQECGRALSGAGRV